MQVTQKTSYAVSQVMNAVVQSRCFDSNKRPYIQAELLEPNQDAFCRDKEPAKFIRVYCIPAMDPEEQKAFINKFSIGQVFRTRPNQPAVCIASTCLGDFVDYFESSQDIKVNQAVVNGQKTSFQVNNLDKELVNAVNARIQSEDLTRTYVVKKLFKGFVAGKYDEDIL